MTHTKRGSTFTLQGGINTIVSSWICQPPGFGSAERERLLAAMSEVHDLVATWRCCSDLCHIELVSLHSVSTAGLLRSQGLWGKQSHISAYRGT